MVASHAQRARSWRPGPLVTTLPATVAFALLFLVPVALFGVYSFLTAALFRASGPLTLANYGDVLGSHVTLQLAKNSLIVGAWTGLACLAIGLPVAYWLRFCAGRWQMPLLFVFVVSMFASYLVRIYAWRTVLGERGLINQGLMQLGLTDKPVESSSTAASRS